MLLCYPHGAGIIIQHALDEIAYSGTDLQCLNPGSDTVKLFDDFR